MSKGQIKFSENYRFFIICLDIERFIMESEKKKNLFYQNEKNVFYIFAHLLENRFFDIYNKEHAEKRIIPVELLPNLQKITGNIPWAIIRYHLEKNYHFGESNKKVTKKTCMSFLTGYHFLDYARAHIFNLCNQKKRPGHRTCDQLEQMVDYEILLPGTLFVLVRKPMPRGFEFFKPPDSISGGSLMEQYGSEEAAIDAIISGANIKKTTGPMKYHASVWGTSRMTVPNPTSGYLCNKCYKPGHFRQYCQQRGHTDLKEATEIVEMPLPSGIPLVNFIKIVDNHQVGAEKKNIIYYDRENNWYYLDKNKYTI